MREQAPSQDFESKLQPLWRRARHGDERAYRQALTLIAARLRGYFGRRLRSMPEEVEDLVQETLLALHQRRGSHDPALPVSNWVHAIAGYKLADWWRRRGRTESLHEPLDAHEAALELAPDEGQAARYDLDTLIGTLPQAQRAAILLTRIEGLSMAEASLRTGVSVAALKVRVHRGLKRLALAAARGGRAK